jgi:hypothetical protein
MRNVKRATTVALALIGLYAGAWLFGDHEMTYAVLPATPVFVNQWVCPEGQADESGCNTQPVRQVVQKWTCKANEEGPFEGENWKPYECHSPATTCPALWFPIVAQTPCPYHDPLSH